MIWNRGWGVDRGFELKKRHKVGSLSISRPLESQEIRIGPSFPDGRGLNHRSFSLLFPLLQIKYFVSVGSSVLMISFVRV